jgi:hypothetical protein
MKTIIFILSAIFLMGSTTVFAGSTGIPDTKWYDENPAADEFVISTADQLAGFAIITNSTTGVYASERFANKTITLSDDIDLSAYSEGVGWTPIGTPIVGSFSGVFDGNNKIITGLRANSGQVGAGLFGGIWNATIKNLGLVDVDVIGSGAGGLVFSGGFSTIENCYVTGTVANNQDHRFRGIVGGIAGSFGGTIKNSYFEGIVSCGISQNTMAEFVGGIAGQFGGIMENCFSAGKILFVSPNHNVSGFFSPLSPPVLNLGGLVGSVWSYRIDDTSTEIQNSIIKNSYSKATIPWVFGGFYLMAGIAGYADNSEITNCVALNPIMTQAPGLSRRYRIVSTHHWQYGEPLTLFGNYALYNTPISQWAPKEHDQHDGADVTMQEALTAAFWTDTMGWDTNIWIIKDGELPRLRMCCTYDNPCAACFVNPPTGVSDVTGAIAAMFVFLLMSAALWGYALINKTRTELPASE